MSATPMFSAPSEDKLASSGFFCGLKLMVIIQPFDILLTNMYFCFYFYKYINDDEFVRLLVYFVYIFIWLDISLFNRSFTLFFL